MDKQFYGVKDIQEIMGISYGTAYTLVHTRGFPKLRVGKRTLVPIKDFDRWVKDRLTDEIRRR